MRTKTVRVEMIDLSVRLYIGSREEINKKLQNERSGFKIGYGLTKRGNKKSKVSYEIFIAEDQREHSVCSILVHELSHVVSKALTSRGAEDESEFRAYLSGHLFEEFERFLK